MRWHSYGMRLHVIWGRSSSNAEAEQVWSNLCTVDRAYRKLRELADSPDNDFIFENLWIKGLIWLKGKPIWLAFGRSRCHAFHEEPESEVQ